MYRITARYSTFDEKLTFASLAMFDIQYLMSDWHGKGAVLPSGLKHVLKQGMKIVGVLVNWKWDRLVTYWLSFVYLLFLFKTVCCEYSLEVPYWGASDTQVPTQYKLVMEK